ncbi:hypothetical protein BGZ65_004805 [Modicella reniformis]|uniref:Uncharacterized protein n=1 Tax=Modicella reniformis TaxID=1440133 RepID=A0A9P6MH56_9FUNG|nr:hypothetical protein BGZ65_004805 [Modicella reniformis]
MDDASSKDGAEPSPEVTMMVCINANALLGTVAMICCIDKVSEGIVLGGPAHQDLIVLPTTKEGFVEFLSGSSPHLLWEYVHQLLNYRDQIKAMLRRKRANEVINPEHLSESERFDVDEVDAGYITPPRSLRPSDLTFLTPKKKKSRTTS